MSTFHTVLQLWMTKPRSTRLLPLILEMGATMKRPALLLLSLVVVG